MRSGSYLQDICWIYIFNINAKLTEEAPSRGAEGQPRFGAGGIGGRFCSIETKFEGR